MEAQREHWRQTPGHHGGAKANAGAHKRGLCCGSPSLQPGSRRKTDPCSMFPFPSRLLTQRLRGVPYSPPGWGVGEHDVQMGPNKLTVLSCFTEDEGQGAPLGL